MILTSKINKEYIDGLLLDNTTPDNPSLSYHSGGYILGSAGYRVNILSDGTTAYNKLHSKLTELNVLLMNREGIQIPNLGQDLWTFPITDDAMYVIIQSRLKVNGVVTYFNDYVPLVNGYFVSGSSFANITQTSRFVLWRIPSYINPIFNSTQRIGIRPIGEEYEILKYEIV